MRFCQTAILILLFFSSLSQQPPDSLTYHSKDGKARNIFRKTNVWRWAIPGTLIGLGVWGTVDSKIINRYEIREERSDHLSGFDVKVDNYAQFAPAAAVYVLNAFGNKPKHDPVNYSVILLKSELIMTAIMLPLKNMTQVLRPDSSSYHSFPSGHTAQAFLAANFLRHEYGYKSIWYSVAGYALASGVGLFRIANNRHWLSDVLAGAGIGLLCSELAYATHQYRWNRKGQFSVLPLINRSGAGFYMAWQL